MKNKITGIRASGNQEEEFRTSVYQEYYTN
jgi:hypothetical protein